MAKDISCPVDLWTSQGIIHFLVCFEKCGERKHSVGHRWSKLICFYSLTGFFQANKAKWVKFLDFVGRIKTYAGHILSATHMLYECLIKETKYVICVPRTS